VNLPAQLAVDLVHCERAAQQAVTDSNGQLRILQGELITVEYFDNLAAEIDEILQVYHSHDSSRLILKAAGSVGLFIASSVSTDQCAATWYSVAAIRLSAVKHTCRALAACAILSKHTLSI